MTLAPWLVRSWAAKGAICIVASVLLGVALAQSPTVAILLAILAAGGAACLVAVSHPSWLFIAAIGAMVLIPTYAAPALGPAHFIAGAVALWILAAGLAWTHFVVGRSRLTITGIDFAFALFTLSLLVSVGFSERPELREFLRLAFIWGGPYVGARLFLRERGSPSLLAAGFAGATVILGPFLAAEALTGANPFTSLTFNPSESAEWASTLTRFGQNRVEASFGHPIALSMFLASSAVLALNMAVHSDGFGRRASWLAVSVIGVGGQALTVSRSGWLLLALGTACVLLTVGAGPARRRLWIVLATVAVGAVVLFSVAPPEQLRVLPGTGSTAGSASVADSGDYRKRLLDRALEPGVLGPWGNPVNKVAPVVSEANFATDNQYIILADTWGLIPLAAFLGLLVTLLTTLVRAQRRGGGPLVVIPAVALANCAGLFFVAFLTQQQVMIWILIGASAAVAERFAAAPVRDPVRRPRGAQLRAAPAPFKPQES